MPFTTQQIHELDVLLRYRVAGTQQGIKVHKNANPDVIEAVRRLHEKGLITQADGGYLTDLGRQAAEHAQSLLLLLGPACDKAS